MNRKSLKALNGLEVTIRVIRNNRGRDEIQFFAKDADGQEGNPIILAYPDEIFDGDGNRFENDI